MTAPSPLTTHLLSLPELGTPRGSFLYSSLPSRKEVNPTGYTGAINWWNALLASLTAKGLLSEHKLILVVDESLREGLRVDGVGRPASLGAVVAEGKLKGDYAPLDAFMSASTSVGWASYLARPLWWGLGVAKRQVLGDGSHALGEGADEAQWAAHKGEWVVRDLVERAAKALIPQLPAMHPDAMSRLYTVQSWHEQVADKCLDGVSLSEKDALVLAKHLANKGLCTRQGEVIKFAPPLGLAKSAPLAITETDRSTLTLLTSLKNLTASVTSLEVRIAQHTASAASYLSKKQVSIAKSHLQSRKHQESLLATRLASRDKLEQVVAAIDKATGDEETMSALALGTTTLRALLASPNLQIDNIEKTTEALSDALADAGEVDEAVNAVGADKLDAQSLQEVDDELAELVAEAKREEDAQKERDARKEKEKEEQKEAERREETRRKLDELKLVEQHAREAEAKASEPGEGEAPVAQEAEARPERVAE